MWCFFSLSVSHVVERKHGLLCLTGISAMTVTLNKIKYFFFHMKQAVKMKQLFSQGVSKYLWKHTISCLWTHWDRKPDWGHRELCKDTMTRSTLSDIVCLWCHKTSFNNRILYHEKQSVTSLVNHLKHEENNPFSELFCNRHIKEISNNNFPVHLKGYFTHLP